MGYVKWELEEYLEREVGDVPDNYVCSSCLNEENLKKYIARHGKRRKCSYSYLFWSHYRGAGYVHKIYFFEKSQFAFGAE